MSKPRRAERVLVDIAMIVAFVLLYVLVLTCGQVTEYL
jgi:hypothetical protein